MQRATTWTVATFAALFLLALVTGVFWGTWFTLTRSITTFSAAEFIHIGQTIIANVAWPMRFLLIVEVPIDNQIRTWTATTMPSDWTMIRARWERFHMARTFVWLGSLASFIVAVLISKKLT